MDELKRCPFCGGKAELEGFPTEYGGEWQVYCTECPATFGFCQNRDEAIAAWNERVSTETEEAVCVWTEGEKANVYTTIWQTSCEADVSWWLKTTPLESGYVYCPNCGGRIVLEPEEA